MITANEMRELSKTSLKTIEEIEHGIKSMAKNGRNYATFRKEEFILSKDDLSTLRENGFIVDDNENSAYIEIKW